MKTATVSLAILSALMLSFASGASATPIIYYTNLSGANESPPNASAGFGAVEVVYDSAAHTLGLRVNFGGLLPFTSGGLPSVTTAAHIHCCTTIPFTGTGSVATTVPAFLGFPLGVTSGSFDNEATPYDLTQASFWNPSFLTAHAGSTLAAETDFAIGLANGTEYFNIHTSAIPGGEIRGFLVRVPEPASLALLGSGLLGIGAMRRRKRRTTHAAA